MLVLLIIFIVAAPMLTQNKVDVDLPEATAKPTEAKEEKLLLSINKKKQVFLGETEVPEDRLEEALKHNERLKEEGELYVQADEAVPYGFVVRVFAAIRQAGVQKLGLVTEPLGQGKGKGQ
jgi:biopolymer transport protein TolR